MTMMNGVMTRGTGKRAASYGINVANFSGKTGTTNDNSDAWFMGYSPQLLCGVDGLRRSVLFALAVLLLDRVLLWPCLFGLIFTAAV